MTARKLLKKLEVESKTYNILNYFIHGGKLTGRSCYHRFHTFRLGGRVHDFGKAGVTIKRKSIKTPMGETVTVYWL